MTTTADARGGRRARIGKLFHVTPLVDSLWDADMFFGGLFTPMTMMRNYSPLWHRYGVVYVIADTAIEPMECLPPPEGERGTSWYRYVESFGPRVHNMAFYTDDAEELAARLEAAGVRTTGGGSESTVFTHPKDTPGMLEFFQPPEQDYEDPRLSPHWPALRDDFWGERQFLGIRRLSHLTVSVHDCKEAARFYIEVLDAVPLPDQPARVADADASYVMVGEDTVLELAQPRSDASPLAADLALAGPGVTGITFTIRDVARALPALELRQAPVADADAQDIVFDRGRTWNTEYRLTTGVLEGDPRDTP